MCQFADLTMCQCVDLLMCPLRWRELATRAYYQVEPVAPASGGITAFVRLE